jgi:TonB family C-terminal domain
MRKIAIMILAMVAVLVPSQLANGRNKQGPEDVYTHYVDGEAAKQLLQALEALPQLPINFEDDGRSPLAVVVASFCQLGQLTGANKSDQGYVLSERITIVNRTDRPIKGAELIFIDVNSQQRFNVSRNIAIEPHRSSVFGAIRDERPILASVPIKLGALNGKIFEVEFEDGTIWSEDLRDVDEAAVPLTRPRSKHTEEALKNKIQGTVRMRVLVGADGEVKRVKVIRGLPDGLDEQSVQQVYSLNFKPAMRAGQPVDCWLLYEIVYNLRLTPGTSLWRQAKVKGSRNPL